MESSVASSLCAKIGFMKIRKSLVWEIPAFIAIAWFGFWLHVKFIQWAVLL
jgi:hypothetical protein